MTRQQIKMFGVPWCPDCKRAKQFLNEQRIPYQWNDIDRDEQARGFLQRANNGKKIIPTHVFGEGPILVEPSNAELSDKLGVQRMAKSP